MKKIVRGFYFRHPKSTVWHFRTECRFLPKEGPVSSAARPKHGALCDFCQSIERKERKVGK